MTILVLGINHKTASIALREKVAFSAEKRLNAMVRLDEIALAENAVILSTCNRTEVYLHNRHIAPQESRRWREACIKWLADVHQLSVEALTDCLYVEQNVQATLHLMRVACGLDSLVLGEPQILGQVKQAYREAQAYYQSKHRQISVELSRLFQKTFSVAKRVRTETDIGGNAVSVAYIACILARQLFDNLSQLSVLLIGAGETIELVSRHLLRHNIKNLFIANRTLENAQKLAEKLDDKGFIQTLSLEQLPAVLKQADIVISSTGSPTPLIDVETVKKACHFRSENPLLIIDIAVPRDVDERVGDIDGVHYYMIDDLQHIIQKNMNKREQACEKALAIIKQENQDFFEWLKVRQFSNLIRQYRETAEQIRLNLLDKALNSLQQGEKPEAVLQTLSHKLTGKLLHQPTRAMQTMVKTGNSQALNAFSGVMSSENENK